MDQVKTALAVVKKQHFWFLISIATIAGLVAWYSASSKLSDEFDAFTSTINQTYSDLDRVKNEVQHPNQVIIEGLKEQTNALRYQVADVWRKLHAEQQNKVLKWPPELKEDFITFINSKKFGDEIHIDFRERYQNYVKERFRELPKIVGAREIAEDEDGNLFGAPARRRKPDDPEPNYIVIWEDQGKIQRKYDWDDAPSAMKVWVTQEELWVYENLLNIIKETNHIATGPHNATISVISAMEVGQDAARRNSSESRVARTEAAETGDLVDEGLGAEAGGADAASSETLALMEGRYLDKSGKPLPAGNASTAEEFKRMPVRLVLQMNPREIPRLITACANAALPVEVDQVRINAGGVKRNTRDTAYTSIIGSENPEETGRRQPHQEVVIHGVIYIFNPLDPAKLGLDKLEAPQGEATLAAPAQPPAEDAAPASGEAATTETAQTPPGSEPPADATDPPAEPAAEETVESPPTESPPADEPPADAPPAAEPPAGEPAAGEPAAEPGESAPAEAPVAGGDAPAGASPDESLSE